MRNPTGVFGEKEESEENILRQGYITRITVDAIWRVRPPSTAIWPGAPLIHDLLRLRIVMTRSNSNSIN